MLNRLIFVLAAMSVVGMASAQDFFHRPSPLAGRTLLTLALFEEVKTELKITPEASTKIDAEVAKIGDDMNSAISGSNGDFAAMRGEIEKVNVKHDEEVLKLLTPEQGARLKQMYIQYNGMASVTQEWVVKDLALTDDQKAKVKKLQDDQWQKMMDAFQGGQDEVQAAMKKGQDDFKDGVSKVLTEDQTKKMKDMEGAKFEFKKAEG